MQHSPEKPPISQADLPRGAQLLDAAQAFVGQHSRAVLVEATTYPEQTITPPETDNA